MNSVEYLIDIQAKMSAGNTVSQLTDIERKMKTEQSTIQNLEAAMKRMGKSANADAEKMARIGAAAEASRGRLAGLADTYAALGSKGATGAATFTKESQKTSNAVGGTAAALGVSMELIGKLPPKWQKVALAVMVAAKAGGALVGVFSRAAKAAYAYGKELVTLGMHESDRQAGDRITFEAYSRSAAMGAHAEKQVMSLADTYGVGTKDLSGFATALLKAGIRGEAFDDGMRAMAIRAAAFGAEAVDVEDVVGRGADGMKGYARAMELAYGDTALKRGQTFEAGVERIKRKIGDLMANPAVQGGLSKMFGAVEGFLNSEKGAAFFDKIGSAAGRAMTAVAEFVGGPKFDALIAGAGDFANTLADLAPKAIAAAQTIGGAFIKVANTIGKVIGKISEAWDHLVNNNDYNIADAARAGSAGQAPEKAAKSGAQVSEDAVNEFAQNAGVGGNAAGVALADGVAAGILSGASTVAAASEALSAIAVDGVKRALEIHSPSRVFARLGRYTAQGFAGGIEDEAPSAESALARMATPPNVIRNGGARSVSFGDQHFHGVRDAEHATALFEERIAALLEGLVLEDGAGA